MPLFVHSLSPVKMGCHCEITAGRGQHLYTGSILNGDVSNENNLFLTVLPANDMVLSQYIICFAWPSLG